MVVRMDVPVVLDPQQLRRDARSGKVSVEGLLDIIDRLRHSIQRLQADHERLRQRLARYEPEAARDNQASAANAATPNASYSIDAENKRRQPRRRRKKSPGRQPTEVKFAAAQREVNIFPDGVPKRQCQLMRERAVWRIEDGKAIRVGYRIHAGPDGKEPRIPGVTPRCEYGIEILVVLAFLVYLVGISLDKACAVMEFFCQLPLSKSQADALLIRSARCWRTRPSFTWMKRVGRLARKIARCGRSRRSCSGCSCLVATRTTPRWTRCCRRRFSPASA